MKQYDKIWVPEKKQGLAFRDSEGDTPSILAGPVIVLSIEELKEMWDECREETWQDARPTTKYEKQTRLPGFEGYMKSKGLTIKQQ